jgi:hypothetical protein
MIPTYSNHSGIHWRKWPGRTACGARAGNQGPVSPIVDCDVCLDLLASWNPDAGWVIKSDAPLHKLELDAGVRPYAKALADMKAARRQQFRWKKELGFYPKLWLEIDTRTIRKHVPAP